MTIKDLEAGGGAEVEVEERVDNGEFTPDQLNFLSNLANALGIKMDKLKQAVMAITNRTGKRLEEIFDHLRRVNLKTFRELLSLKRFIGIAGILSVLLSVYTTIIPPNVFGGSTQHTGINTTMIDDELRAERAILERKLKEIRTKSREYESEIQRLQTEIDRIDREIEEINKEFAAEVDEILEGIDLNKY